MPLKIALQPRTKLEFRPGSKTQISLRLTPPNVRMLNRAMEDHPILSNIINAAIADYLTRHGYARKREKAA